MDTSVMQASIIKNQEGQVSGAKLILLVVCVLPAAWVIRDFFLWRELTENHIALMGILLIVGLVNRMSARKRFRIKVKDYEVETSDDDEG